MKRYGEKATREALTNGATIRYNEHFTADPGYRVRLNGETLGYIVQDLFLKLFHDGTIEVSRVDYSFEEYTMTAQAAEKHPFSVAACVAHIRNFHVKLKHQDAPEVMTDLLHCEDVNGSMFNRNMWKAFEIVFPNFPVSMEVACNIYGAAADFDGKVEDLDRVARNIREYGHAIIWEEEDARRAEEQEAQEQPQEAPQPEPKYYRNCETQETTNSATEAMSWHRAGINVTVCQRLAADHVRIVRISGAPQEQPKSEDEENREYAQRIAQEVETYYRGHLRRCPCCEAIVERDDWDGLDVFTCPHCNDLDDVGQWEALTLHDYLEDVLDITYIVQSDRQTLDGAKFYVTLGGPSVWLDTCSRSVELRWGGRSASWGLTWNVCEALDEIAQEYWDMG